MAVYPMTAYPKKVDLRDGEKLTIRPMFRTDGDALLDFFLRIPEEDRFYLKEDVTSPAVLQQWADNLNYWRVLPLLAVAGDTVVADSTLHRRSAGARKHMGEVRIVVDPGYRNMGLGTLLVRELILIARDSGLDRLVFELVEGVQSQAIATAQALGFVRLAALPDHVRDLHGKPHDLLLMELQLGKWQEWWDYKYDL